MTSNEQRTINNEKMRSELSAILKRAYAKAKPESVNLGRRDFIKKSTLASIALSLPLTGCWNPNSKKNVVIVGAGIAGLTAAYHLKKAGIESTLYEATGRAGGRVLTVDNAVIDGSHVDFGGEYIDTIHEDLLTLSKELNVELNDLRSDTLSGKTFYFEGKLRTEEELVEALKPFAEQIENDIATLPADLHYSKAESFKALDEQSVIDYLKGIGMTGWALSFLDMAILSEYAMECSEQSALNLLLILSTPIQYDEHYHIFGNYHEVMKFKGGSQQFITKLSEHVKDQIKINYRLKSLNKKDNQYDLIFEFDGKAETITADVVVLTIPFSVLKKLEMNFKFPERKQLAIETSGFGNASKVAMGFNKRTWRDQGSQGYTFNDINNTVIWDSSQAVDTKQGSLTFVGGGKISEDFFSKSYTEIKDKWLGDAEKIYPGLLAQYNGKISKFCWAAHPFAKGSYTSYKVGQWSKFAGVEGEPFENIFFAGEHCSIKHQGFMNGAAETGRIAASEIVKQLSVKS